MADEEVEQLVVSLQAARHDSRTWDDVADHASISMLLYGHQVAGLPMHCRLNTPTPIQLALL